MGEVCPNMYTSDKEAIILEYIYYNDSLKQRELADKAGISLGMTNAILKRLIEKGWLMTKRLNSRNISYVVSPKGMEEIFKRGYRYFKRTIDNVHFYKTGIEQLISEASAAGHRTIALVGKSDLDFIIEYSCEKNNLTFKMISDPKEAGDNMFVLFSEQCEISDKVPEKQWLRNIVIKGNKDI